MKRGLGILILATAIFAILRYTIPKEFVMQESEKVAVIDDFLKDNIPSDSTEIQNATIANPELLPQETPMPVFVNDTVLDKFFEKLSRLEKKKKGQVRIAYFGDSMVEADMIVMQLRHYMQERFGGVGVGFVPITSVSASGRYTIKHKFFGAWDKETFLKKNDTTFLFGLNGETFFVGDSIQEAQATVQFRRGGAYQEAKPLINPLLFYGKKRQLDSLALPNPVMTVSYDEDKLDTLKIASPYLLNTTKLPQGQKQLKLTISDSGTLPLYGVSFASKQGVVLDNLSIRGNSGLPLSRLNKRLMRAFQKYMNYDLLILGYGTNVFSPDYERGYAWYADRMERVVSHLRDCFPSTEIMIVSMADRAVKQDEQMKTPARLASFIRQQQRLAQRTQSAFFNLYAKMGGAGSMVEWAEGEPPLANKDYTHFNSKGAEKVAGFMWDWFVDLYESYNERKNALQNKKYIINESRTVFWLIQPHSYGAFGHSELHQRVFRFSKGLVCGESSESSEK